MMSGVQFSNQANQESFKDHYPQKIPLVDQGKTKAGVQLKFVPVAIVCALIFVGAVVFSKINTQRQLAQQGGSLDFTNAGITGNLVRENAIQSQDQLGAETPATPAAQTRLTGLATPPPLPTDSLTASASAKATPRPVVTPTPSNQTTTTKGGTIVPTPLPATPKPTTTTTTNSTSSSGGTTTTTVTVQEDNTYKPETPKLETCGEYRDNRWHDLKVVLPKFEHDGKAAVEYWVQVGKSNGSNDVKDQRFSQTDRVVFADTYDNSQEYFVRFAIRMDGGDWQKWSNTLRFKCERK